MGSKTTWDPIDFNDQNKFFQNMLHWRMKVIHCITLYYTRACPTMIFLCRNNIWHFEIKVIAAMTALPLKGKMKK